MFKMKRQPQQQQATQSTPTMSAQPSLAGNDATQDTSNSAAVEAAAAGGQSESAGADAFAGALGAAEEAEKVEIPNRDIVYEQLAHDLAYKDGGSISAIGDSARPDLGYEEVGRIDDKETDMQAVAFRPFASDLLLQEGLELPEVGVVAFRGTEMTHEKDWRTDFGSGGVGYAQFQANESEIRGLMGSVGRCDVTGHSLGGALAQLAACRVGGVREIVTFQAPGIDPADLALLDEDVESTHYRSGGDLVDNAGAAHSEGKVVDVDTNAKDPASAHTNFLLADIGDERGLELEGTGHGIEGIEVSDTSKDNQWGEQLRKVVALAYESTLEVIAAWPTFSGVLTCGTEVLEAMLPALLELAAPTEEDEAPCLDLAEVEKLIQQHLEDAGVPSAVAWVAADYLAEAIVEAVDGLGRDAAA